MSTGTHVLKTAAEIVGGAENLARRLGIGDRILAAFMQGARALPDGLLLQALDVILEGRARMQVPRTPDTASRDGT